MTELDLSFIPSLYTPSALLPISRHKDSLLYTVETHQVTVLVGQTGSGKTTQLPQFLEQAGWCSNGKCIAVTQPRRVAVTTVATRVAEEMRCKVGEEVGYSIRFEDVTSSRTKIKFLTDGMLLREALVDPLLSRYSVIMVDEAHERSLSSDILLGLLKKIKKRRPELRIIVSSATLDAERFADFFKDKDQQDGSNSDQQCRIVSIEGRTYPVDILYLDQPTENYVEKAVHTAFTIHQQEGPGDILVFLTGREEIETAMQKLSDLAATLHPQAQALQPLPLYAGLSTEEQMYVFSEAAENTRKVILSTNISEASVTISGIVYVIDCGFVKLRAYNPTTNIDTLTPFPVSKASATQRAGRAGRTKPGKCFRLYTEQSYESLPATTTPEIQRSNLAPVVLQLKALGIDNIVRFDFLSPPPSQLLIRAFDLLYSLGAVDEYAKLTSPLGTRMAELSIPPMMAKCLLVSSDSKYNFNCQSEMLTIAAMTSLEGNVWFHHSGEKKAMDMSRRKFTAEEGDHLTLLNVYTAFVTKGKKEARWCHDHHLNFKSMQRALSIRNQLARYLERLGVKVVAADNNAPYLSTAQQQPLSTADKATNILKCLVTGYFSQAAKMQPDGSFRSVSGNVTMYAHPTSLLFNRKADYVIFHEVLETGGKVYIKDLSKVEKGWLVDLSGGYYNVKT
ncbi:putative ATP-dependent RNA helicase DHX35 [Exophiala dermatitidis]